MDQQQDIEALTLTASIVSAHVSHNAVKADDLPNLIISVFQSIKGVNVVADRPPELIPAVPIKKSVFSDHIICLEDGKKLKMLRRHIQTAYGLTPEAYRTKWGLPYDYPMVAPDYAEKRSELAKTIGLGRKPSDPAKRPLSFSRPVSKAAPPKRVVKPEPEPEPVDVEPDDDEVEITAEAQTQEDQARVDEYNQEGESQVPEEEVQEGEHDDSVIAQEPETEPMFRSTRKASPKKATGRISKKPAKGRR